jgi:ferritin-like metal-binding protein YciE
MAKLALRELYIEELRDLYDAENRMIKALPKLAEAAESEKLRAGFKEHLQQTKSHVARLEQVFEKMGEELGGSTMGAIPDDDEMDYMIDEEFEHGVKDAALISAAQRVEHYEIAAYGCVRTWAGLLGEKHAQALLDQTLNEEKQTQEKLTELSQAINLQATNESAGTEIASNASD